MPDTVVLVHGLWVHGITMELMRRRIERQGYRALAYSYPSMKLTLDENEKRLAQYCRNLEVPRLHFVGHSLGGLIVLHLLERERGLAPGRVVLIGTPVAGSYAAERLARLPGGRAALGRSMRAWLASPRPAVDAGRDIGVIAGRLPVGLGRIVAPRLPGPSDGVVSVAETRLPGMRDHVVLNVNHTGMLLSALVARQIGEFLRHGAFLEEGGGRRST